MKSEREEKCRFIKETGCDQTVGEIHEYAVKAYQHIDFHKLSSKNVLSSATGDFRSINDARPRSDLNYSVVRVL